MLHNVPEEAGGHCGRRFIRYDSSYPDLRAIHSLVLALFCVAGIHCELIYRDTLSCHPPRFLPIRGLRGHLESKREIPGYPFHSSTESGGISSSRLQLPREGPLGCSSHWVTQPRALECVLNHLCPSRQHLQ